jgi:hypothetical protein
VSDRANPESIDVVIQQALKDFAAAVIDVITPVGAEAFSTGPSQNESVAIVRSVNQVLDKGLAGALITKLDDEGLDVGGAHVSTQLALFAQGKASSPIAEIIVTKTRTIPLASAVTKAGAIAATCTLMTTLTYERPDAEGHRIVSTSANVTLDLSYTSPKKTLMTVKAPFIV